MNRAAKARVIAFSLAGLCLLGGWLVDSKLSLAAAETRLEYVYRRSLGDLTDYVSSMQANLQKAMYAGTASTQTALSAQLIEQSGGAKAALAALPFSQEKTERIDRFLSQVGDYSLALSRKALAGQQLDRSDLQSISNLMEYAGKLTDALTGLQARLTAEQEDIVHTVSLLNNLEEPEPMALLDEDISQVAEEFAAFPALLYDGPFSDHIERREPLYLKGRDTVTQKEACGVAAGLLGCGPDELTLSGQGGGRLPVFSFVLEGDGGGSMVNVSCQGGEPAYYKKSGAIASSSLSYSQALKAAKAYLEGLGFPEMRESYYLLNDNLCTINFHTLSYTPGGQEVICYPDLVKVVIELDEGGTVEFDSTGYLMNSRARDLPEPTFSKDKAMEAISPFLRADSACLALIPTPGIGEALCWELHCTSADGVEVLSYINAQTGAEEQLYLLRRDEHGVLAA